MSKFKKVLALLLVVALTAALSVSLTMAYLQDEDSDVNVMTLGNVEIEQIEQQRDGKGKLEGFKQGQGLYPVPEAPGGYIDLAGLKTDGKEDAYKFLAGSNGNSLPNALDKIVTVKNTGKSDAYVRTIFAFEIVNSVAEVQSPGTHIGLFRNDISAKGESGSGNSEWSWAWLGEAIEVDGQKYAVAVALHNAPLASKAETIPSLTQVYLKSNADNDYVAELGETYDILVLSQAVQVKGFETVGAAAALNEAFGEITAANHPWADNAPVIPVVASTADELKAALEKGESIVLGGDVDVKNPALEQSGYTFAILADSNINGQGNKLLDSTGGDIGLYVGDATLIENVEFESNSQLATNFQNKNATVTMKNSSVNGDDTALYFQGAKGGVILEDITATANGVAVSSSLAQGVVFATKSSNGDHSIVTIKSGTYTANEDGAAAVWSFYNSVVTIEGGTFTGLLKTATGGKIVIKGGTFNVDPSAYVADGYVAAYNGGVWTVTAK